MVESDSGTISLNCSADGNPAPTVTWTRVFSNGSDSDLLFTGNPYVINSNRINAGRYRCKADNSIGSAINQTIHVTVNCKYTGVFPSFSGYMLLFLNKQNSNVLLMLDCLKLLNCS